MKIERGTMNNADIKSFFKSVQDLGQGMQTRDLDKLPDINVDELKDVAGLLSYNIAMNKLRKEGTSFVWHVAMPKSGSTWISKVIGSHLADRDWKSVWIGGHKKASHEIDLPEIYRLGLLDNHIFAEHSHSLASDFNMDMARLFNSKILLQVRSIPDALMSLLDHLGNEGFAHSPVVFYKSEYWAKLDNEQRISFILNFAAPWFIRFWASWYTYLKENSDINCMIVNYDDLLDNPQAAFQNIADFCEGSASPNREFSDVSATRKNKAIKGRGQDFPEHFLARLKEMASFYPDVDFRPVGLG